MSDRLYRQSVLDVEIDSARRAVLEGCRLIDQAAARRRSERRAGFIVVAREPCRDAQQLRRQPEGGMAGHDDAKVLALDDRLELLEGLPLGDIANELFDPGPVGGGIAFAQAVAQPLR